MPDTKEDPTKAVNRAVVSTGPVTAGCFVVHSLLVRRWMLLLLLRAAWYVDFHLRLTEC